MGKITGFKDYKRKNFTLAPVAERIKHYNEFTTPLSKEEMAEAIPALEKQLIKDK